MSCTRSEKIEKNGRNSCPLLLDLKISIVSSMTTSLSHQKATDTTCRLLNISKRDSRNGCRNNGLYRCSIGHVFTEQLPVRTKSFAAIMRARSCTSSVAGMAHWTSLTSWTMCTPTSSATFVQLLNFSSDLLTVTNLNYDSIMILELRVEFSK